MHRPYWHRARETSPTDWQWLMPAAVAMLFAAGALQFLSFRLSILAIYMSWITCAIAPWSLPVVRANRRAAVLISLCLLPFWYVGFDSPFHWDAVQTAIRANIFWETGVLERVSPFYIALSPFVALFPATAQPAHLFVMSMGVVTILLIGLAVSRIAGRDWAFRAIIISAALPPIYLIHRWVVLDTFLLFIWVSTLCAMLFWSRHLTIPRLLVLLALTAVTVGSKEMGALILIPVTTGLILLAPHGRKRRRLLLVLAILLCALPIVAFSLARYAELHHIKAFFSGVLHTDRGVTFLPFNSALPKPWYHYMKRILSHHLSFWAQSGLLIPMILALFQPMKRMAGWIIAAAGAATQLAWIILCRPEKWVDIYTFPVFNGNPSASYFIPFGVFLVLLLVLWIGRGLKLKIGRMEWVLLAAIVPGIIMLVSFMKVNFVGEGRLNVWLAWNYSIVLLAGGVLLATRGFRRITRYYMPRMLTGFCLIVIMLTYMNAVLHGAGMALRFRAVDMARVEAYDWMRTQPQRTVYSHWPFIYESDTYKNWDNGPLAWKTDQWKVLSIREFYDPNRKPEMNSFLLWDAYRDYGLPTDALKSMGVRVYVASVSIWRLALFNRSMDMKASEAAVVHRVGDTSAQGAGGN